MSERVVHVNEVSKEDISSPEAVSTRGDASNRVVHLEKVFKGGMGCRIRDEGGVGHLLV